MNMLLHIGMNGSMLDEHPTGVGVYSANIINHLSKLYQQDAERKITVFTPTNTFLNKNISIVRLPGLLKSSQYGKLAALTRFLWNTFSYPLQTRKYNLLISTTTHGSFMRKNQIITIHDLLSLRFNNVSSHQRFYYRYLLPFMVSKARKVIAVSETTKNDIMHFLKCPESKIKVIYNGYDENKYYVAGTSKKILEKYGVTEYFLAIGPTYPHKNFKLLIEAYHELDISLKTKYPLVIAGGKKLYLSEIKKYAQEIKADPFVHFIGYVPEPLMPFLYREAFALIFPSLYEGFGFPLLESMASGCPVIASNISSIPEVCGDAALYFDPFDKISLQTKIKNLIDDIQLQTHMKEKGLLQAAKFSWQKTVEQFKEVIEENINFSQYKATL